MPSEKVSFTKPFEESVGGEWWLPEDTGTVRFGTFNPETFELELLHGWPYPQAESRTYDLRTREIPIVFGKVLSGKKMQDVTLLGCRYSSMGLEDQSSNTSNMTQTATIRPRKILLGTHMVEPIDEINITTDLTERLTNLPNINFRYTPQDEAENRQVIFNAPEEHDVFEAALENYSITLTFTGRVSTKFASPKATVTSSLIWNVKYKKKTELFYDELDNPINELLTFISLACFEKDAITEVFIFVDKFPYRIFINPGYNRFVETGEYDKARTNSLFALNKDKFSERYAKLVGNAKLLNFATKLLSRRGDSSYIEDQYGLIMGLSEKVVREFYPDSYYEIKPGNRATEPEKKYKKLAQEKDPVKIAEIEESINNAHQKKGRLISIFSALIIDSIIDDVNIEKESVANTFKYFRDIVAHGDDIDFKERHTAFWVVRYMHWKIYHALLKEIGVDEAEYLKDTLGNQRYNWIIARLIEAREELKPNSIE